MKTESSQELPLAIRLADQSDVSFIFSSWLKSYRKALSVKGIPNNVYFQNHHKLIERILKRAPVLVAVNSEDRTQIIGYIAAERIQGVLTVHYVYVKETYRKLGIAKRLMKEASWNGQEAFAMTHSTPVVDTLMRRTNSAAGIFHPYLIMGLDEVANDGKKDL